MGYSDRTVAGVLIFISMVIFLFGLNIAEQVYPGYSVSMNYISDLGGLCNGSYCQILQPSATIFNSSIFVAGLLILIAAFFVRRAFRKGIFAYLLALAGIGTMCIGIYPEPTGEIHYIVALGTFICGGLAAIVAFTIVRPPIRYFSFLLGLVIFGALGMFVYGVDLGLGPGGMERLIVYPFIILMISLSGYFMHSCKEISKELR